MALSKPTIPDDIVDALDGAFGDDKADDYGRIVYFLSTSLENETADPFIHALKAVVKRPAVFKSVAERLARDTKTAEENPKYRQFMQDVWSNFLKEDGLVESNHGQSWGIVVRADRAVKTAQFTFMGAVHRLSPKNYNALKQVAEGLSGKISVFDKALTSARSAKTVVGVALATVLLAWDIIKNIHRWYKGEISGIRCVKNIIDNGVSAAAGLAGAVGGEMTGAALGALAGPVGMGIGAIVGGVLGGVGASHAASVLCDRLTQWIFGLPKTEALENAYGFIGVRASASNGEVNTAYRRLSLKHHPDKGGKRDNWTRLQYSMAVIHEARGES